MPTILISGAARGLGFAFLEAYRIQPSINIIAIDKLPIPAQYDNIRSFRVDVTDESSIKNLAESLNGEPIDLVIHSVGVRGLVPHLEQQHHGDVNACERLEAMDLATLTRTFQTNAAGTFLLLQSLLPNLARSPSPKVIVMSSRMGSIGNNYSGNRAAGSAYAYRASKAALNAIVQSFAVDVPHVSFILCHPGRVETGLVRWKEEGAISAEESVSGLLPLIDRWGKEHTVCFYDRFGKVIPW
jgi:NAD(P)-dependent dehydrogenase (short-subunit alcohol dehydrogenase family)